MVDIANCAIIVLASGQSRRFKSGDKLLAPFRGRPIAAHIADLAQGSGAQSQIAVTPLNNEALGEIFARSGFDVLVNPRPEAGQGTSLSLGARSVQESNVEAAFVLLADMPLVTKADLNALCAALPLGGAAIAFDGKRRTPPALFHRDLLPQLAKLSGDSGARDLLDKLENVVSVAIDPARLADIDTMADLVNLDGESLSD